MRELTNRAVKTGPFLGFIWILLVFLCLPIGSARAGVEQSFEMLQIGTKTYKNVTVTTKSKDYVFLLHSAGMANIKVSDLTPDELEKLGYTTGTGKSGFVSSAGTEGTKGGKEAKDASGKGWAQRLAFPKFGAGATIQDWEKQAARMGEQLRERLVQFRPQITGRMILMAAAVTIFLFLCYSYCCALICTKAGRVPGALIWIPILQLFPLLRTARMSPAWFLICLVPVLNAVAAIVWSFKIAAARGKSAWVGFFLLLPVTSLFAFLYLAFSNGNEKATKKHSIAVPIMTLETA